MEETKKQAVKAWGKILPFGAQVVASAAAYSVGITVTQVSPGMLLSVGVLARTWCQRAAAQPMPSSTLHTDTRSVSRIQRRGVPRCNAAEQHACAVLRLRPGFCHVLCIQHPHSPGSPPQQLAASDRAPPHICTLPHPCPFPCPALLQLVGFVLKISCATPVLGPTMGLVGVGIANVLAGQASKHTRKAIVMRSHPLAPGFWEAPHPEDLLLDAVMGACIFKVGGECALASLGVRPPSKCKKNARLGWRAPAGLPVCAGMPSFTHACRAGCLHCATPSADNKHHCVLHTP
jgi:hypothetical protein